MKKVFFSFGLLLGSLYSFGQVSPGTDQNLCDLLKEQAKAACSIKTVPDYEKNCKAAKEAAASACKDKEPKREPAAKEFAREPREGGRP